MQVAGSLSMTEALAREVEGAGVVTALLQPTAPATIRRGSKRNIEARRREGFPKREGWLSRTRINGILYDRSLFQTGTGYRPVSRSRQPAGTAPAEPGEARCRHKTIEHPLPDAWLSAKICQTA